MQIIAKAKISNNHTPDEVIQLILSNRGIVGDTNIAQFFNPSLPDLDKLIKELGIDTMSLAVAKNLVEKAIANKQNICVYGDYDADGITATAIIWLTLKLLGARVLPFIPDRTRHGYGLSDTSVQELITGQAFTHSNYPNFIPDLIITVDNGVVANKQVATLKKAGKIVIVTDHHQKGESLPKCDSLIHTVQTSGAGIAWVVARYLSSDATFAKERIDLATIGIVADQMPVVGVNRAIVKQGLQQIAESNLLGLATLLHTAGIFGKSLTTYDINFVIGPRINAVGRMNDALQALRLLCTNNKILAQKLSKSMEELNKQRQQITEKSIKSALSQLDEHKITVLASKNYHHGVIGLIAGKLAETSHKPAVVMSIDGDLVKGSARSVSGVNITNLLRQHHSLLHSVGGHEQAAGFSLSLKNLPEFTKALTSSADKSIDSKLLNDTMYVELDLPLELTTQELTTKLSLLEPYGIGNQKPRFVSHDLVVLEDKILGEDGKHHKLTLEQGGVTRTALWFNGQSITGKIKSLVYTLDINVWQNKKTVQLITSYVEL